MYEPATAQNVAVWQAKLAAQGRTLPPYVLSGFEQEADVLANLWPRAAPGELVPEGEKLVLSQLAQRPPSKEASKLINDTFKASVPPRAKGELGIERLRAADLLVAAFRVKRLDVLIGLPWLRDFSLVKNWLYVMVSAPPEVFDQLVQRSFAPVSYEWIDQLKDMSNALKKLQTPLSSLGRYLLEGHNLTGFRFLPYEGFDIAKDWEIFTATVPDESWSLDTMRRFFRAQRWRFKPLVMSFRDFLTDFNLWTTQGASSVAKVWFRDANGKLRKMKPTKAMLPYLMSLDDLEQLCRSATPKIVSYMALKNETGKVRPIVTASLESYLIQAFLTHTLGKYWADHHWMSNIDSIPQTIERYEILAEATTDAGVIAASVDYKRHEIQIPQSFQVEQAAYECEMAQTLHLHEDTIWAAAWNTRALQRVEVIADNVDGFSAHAKDVKVLTSGQEITAKSGGTFGLFVLYIAEEKVRSTGLKAPVLYAQIRGDDLVFLSPSMAHTVAVIEAISDQGMDIAFDKFSAGSRSCEFLRVRVDAGECYGYVMRSLSAVTAKPWNNTPRSTTNVMESVFEGLATSYRRGAVHQDVIMDVALSHYAFHVRDVDGPPTLIRQWLEAPRSAGGLGLNCEKLSESPIVVRPQRFKLDGERQWNATPVLKEGRWWARPIFRAAQYEQLPVRYHHAAKIRSLRKILVATDNFRAHAYVEGTTKVVRFPEPPHPFRQSNYAIIAFNSAPTYIRPTHLSQLYQQSKLPDDFIPRQAFEWYSALASGVALRLISAKGLRDAYATRFDDAYSKMWKGWPRRVARDWLTHGGIPTEPSALHPMLQGIVAKRALTHYKRVFSNVRDRSFATLYPAVFYRHALQVASFARNKGLFGW